MFYRVESCLESLGAKSSLDQLQWVRTTRTCSSDHWPSVGGGFCVKCLSRLGLYASRVFFILVTSEPVTITEQQVSYEWWEQHKEGDSSRTWAEWGLYLWNEELCSVDFLSYKPDPLEKLEPQETNWVVLFCLDPTTDTKQIKTFLPCEKLFVTATDYRSCMSCCWFSCAAYSIFRPGHFRQLCSEL